MFVERDIAGLLKQIARQDVVEIGSDGSIGTARGASLAHIAESYGFEYYEALRTGHKKANVLVRMYRDPRPEARAREAAVITAHPQAGNGGTVPGMRQGTLKALPEAAGAVALMKDRILFDTLAAAADKRQQMTAYGSCAFVVLLMLVVGEPVLALAVGGLLTAFLVGAFRLGAVRRSRIAQRLQDAGYLQVRDEHGAQRFLRPGQQLPGHANPFAC
ncbi:hypothetical protein [Streptomyces sp. NBC_01264]|uniref:hypothetical protein n=1 Tax=Streptomyces sp. NBC_01264 TaxID=2903804 RepID=UPI0022557334|nr:hypothetical protein [Streptomyces sp. NBC_01264]MCX4778797.1 hypothetical protein [Streptomyces sp. NBC_01264]